LTDRSRRAFLARGGRGLLGALGAGSLGPWLAGCASAATRAAAPQPLGTTVDVGALTAEGQTMVAPGRGPDGAPILIVRGPAGRFLAFSLHCPHEGCPVNPTPTNGVLTCPCHGSQFNLEGKVLRGPADYPLGKYESHYDARADQLAIKFGL
jgi:Rieske Fe-S protein